MAPASLPPSLFSAAGVDFSLAQPLEVWLQQSLESAQPLSDAQCTTHAAEAAGGGAAEPSVPTPAGSSVGLEGASSLQEKAQVGVADARATAANVGPSSGDPSRGLSCSLCGVPQFTSVAEQRRHFKSDWHRYNVKRQLRGRSSVSEEGFAGSLESRGIGATGEPAAKADSDSDVSSISASDASSEGEGDDDGQGSAEIKPRALSSGDALGTARGGTGRIGVGPGRAPKEWFTVDSAQGQCFGVWRALVQHHRGPPLSSEGALRPEEKTAEKQAGRVLQWIAQANKTSSRAPRTAATGGSSRKDAQEAGVPLPEAGGILWAVILSMGGHFAGVIVDAAQQAKVLHHKTFHRYVVRAKAGGRQSTKDGAGRAIHSAGSSLRRHNEAALTKDIGNLLWEWRGLLAAASLIVVHAPSANESAVFDTARGPSSGGAPREHHSPLHRADPRVCSPPFTVRRPTYKEACRVAQRLADLEWLPLEDLRCASGTSAQAALAPLAPQATQEATKAPQPPGSLRPIPEVGPLEERNGLGGTTTSAGPAGGRAEGVPGALEALRLEEAEKAQDLSARSGTASGELELHAASAAGDATRVAELLAQGWDPTVRDGRGRTAYAVATSKETRDAFRRHMGLAPAQWDWHAAGVPSALTGELEAAQAAKRAEKEQKRKAKEKERKKAARLAKQQQQQQEQQERERVQEQQRQQAQEEANRAQAEIEAKARERELRAAAAERRLGSIGQQPASKGSTAELELGTSSSAHPSCDTCQRSLANLVPFYRLAYKYCSTTCLRAHKAVLEGSS